MKSDRNRLVNRAGARSRWRGVYIAAFVAVALFALTACTIAPPQYIVPVIAPTIEPEYEPTASPTPVIAVEPDPDETSAAEIGEPTETPNPEGVLFIDDLPGQPGGASSPEPGGEIPEPTPPSFENQAESGQPTARETMKVEIFYPGMASMMGFVDAPISTIYENTMEAIAASVSLRYPNAELATYRYSLDIPKEDMLLPRETLLANIGDPSFFRDIPLNEQPPRIKPEGKPLRIQSEKMNEPVASFYEMLDRGAPEPTSLASGTVVALTASDPNALTLLVTDLHELRIDDGTMISALSQNALSTGRSIGILAVTSEFAGYIPDVGANKTAFVWGAPPTGTLDYTLDFTDYKVGVSIDPQNRAVKSRPFYVLCLGDQTAVSDTLQTLSDRLSREFASNEVFRLRTALYGSNYVSDGYTLAGNMTYIQGQGVTAMADPASPSGVSRVELKASTQSRFLEWVIEYPVHATDPRSGHFAASDFLFEARVAGEEQGKSLTQLEWSVVESDPGTVSVTLRMEFPSGFIERGEYRLTISGALTAPSDLPGMEWVDIFGWDPEGAQMLEIEQNVSPFQGDRTLYLSRLLGALGQAHIARVGNTPLGEVELTFVVIG
ncbi:MAG: hypothetical protein LBS72_03035 [Oscillospiraceae bacterium]|nr:hypothetical protein [Oscillospiraceae bacterium]